MKTRTLLWKTYILWFTLFTRFITAVGMYIVHNAPVTPMSLNAAVAECGVADRQKRFGGCGACRTAMPNFSLQRRCILTRVSAAAPGSQRKPSTAASDRGVCHVMKSSLKKQTCTQNITDRTYAFFSEKIIYLIGVSLFNDYLSNKKA